MIDKYKIVNKYTENSQAYSIIETHYGLCKMRTSVFNKRS